MKERRLSETRCHLSGARPIREQQRICVDDVLFRKRLHMQTCTFMAKREFNWLKRKEKAAPNICD